MNDLFESILSGDFSLVLNLVESGSDLNVCDEDGRTPLMYAVLEKELEVVKLLIDNGAKLDIQDGISNATALHFAAQEYVLDIGELLLTNKAIVDVTDVNGNTPLSDAVFYSEGKCEFIELLLRFGADPNRKNNFGVSPYELANEIDNYEIKTCF